MPRIGVYSVDSTELKEPPSDREYEQKGLYDSDDQKWVETADSRIQCILPDKDDKAYSFEEIQETIESSTTHVYLEDEVPGTITKPFPSANSFQFASD